MPVVHLASIPDRAGARVAVIDSGIHAAHPHVQHVACGVAFDARGERHDDFIDRLGHGTAVAAAVREKAPGAELIAVKVFDRTLAATGSALAAAIRWCADRDVDVVNLSLGTLNPDHEPDLVAAVRAIEQRGRVIIAAAEQEGMRWLPGAIPSPAVIAVTLDWTCPRDECVASLDKSGRITMRASGWPRPIPGVPPERNLKGISFAVANATGFVARLVGRGDDPPAERLQRAFIDTLPHA